MKVIIIVLFIINFNMQASSTVEVDPDAVEKLQIKRSDFIHALQYDVKPVSKHFTLRCGSPLQRFTSCTKNCADW
jgi:hypothetical protein